MTTFLKKVPLPMAGLTLGLASLGNLYKLAGWQLAGDVTGIVALLLFAVILLKLCLTPLHAAKSLQDPIIASVSPTFSMTLMILCTYFTAWGMPVQVATVVWVMAVLIHFGLMAFFLSRHLLTQQKAWHMIYPSWFVTFVGLGVIPVTSAQFVPCFGATTFLDCICPVCRVVSRGGASRAAGTITRSHPAAADHHGGTGLTVLDRLSRQL